MFRQLQERLWVQMAGQLERRNPLLGKAFVLNQLDVCVAMLHDRGVTTDGRADFDDVLQQRLQALVDDIINSTFKSLVAFVRSAENDQRDTAATSSEPPIAELDKMVSAVANCDPVIAMTCHSAPSFTTLLQLGDLVWNKSTNL